MSTKEELKVIFTAEDKNLKSSLNSMNNELKKVKGEFEGLSKIGGSMTSLGKKLTLGLTVPIAGIATASIKSSSDIESAFAGVRKTLDVSGKSAEEAEKDFKKIEDGIISLSKKMPTAATEIAGVAEAAGQLGIKTENVLGFTEVMVKLGDTTNLSAEEAATALARLANITGMPQTEFDRLGSTIVALGNNLATTEQEITAMGLRLAGAGSQVGMTEAQIMSFAGALSSVGIEAEAGGSAFSKVMIDIQLAVEKSGARLEEFAKVAGMSSSEFKKAFEEDASQAIIAFIKGLGDAEKQGKSAIGILDEMEIKEVRLRDTLLRAAGASDVFSDALELGNQAWEENSALTNEANQRYETTASQLTIAKNELIAAGKAIGDSLLPYVRDLAQWIANLADKFANLNPNTQTFIMIIGAILALIGPLISIIGGCITAFMGLSVASTVLGIGMLPLAGIIVGIVAAIGLLIGAGIWLCQNWDLVKQVSQDTWNFVCDTITSIIDTIVEWTINSWNTISQWTVNTWNSIGDFLSNMWNGLLSLGGQVFNAISSVISGAWQWVVNSTTSIWNGIKSFVSGLWNGMKSTASSIFEGIGSAVSSVWNAISRFTSNTWNNIKTGTKNAWDAVKKAISDPIDKAKEAVSKAVEAMKKVLDVVLPSPKLKMPHLSITGGFSIMPPSVPKFSVSWYSKGGIFKRPTVMGGVGVGDAHNGIGSGAEAVLPIDKLPELLGLDKKEEGLNVGYDIPIIINIDGREVFRAMSPHMGRAVRSW